MKRQIAFLEAKLGMDDSTVNEDTDCREELKFTSCQESEIPMSDANLIKTMDCDNKYMRLSSDEDVIPDSFPGIYFLRIHFFFSINSFFVVNSLGD